MARIKGEKKEKQSKDKFALIIFVEGETEKKFYEELIKFLVKKNENREIFKYEIVNLRGIGKFESKMIPKFENGISKKAVYKGYKFNVVCSYDKDVFIYQSNPAVDWDDKKKKFKKLKVKNIVLIEANKMIEDWFLIDYQGVCKYLNISTKYPKGNDANKKMESLFEQAGKVYIKGNDTGEFIPYLDMNKIYDNLKENFSELENLLFNSGKE